jgi:hypothetical protein
MKENSWVAVRCAAMRKVFYYLCCMFFLRFAHIAAVTAASCMPIDVLRFLLTPQ